MAAQKLKGKKEIEKINRFSKALGKQKRVRRKYIRIIARERWFAVLKKKTERARKPFRLEANNGLTAGI